MPPVHDSKIYNKSALKADFVRQNEFSMVGDTAYGIARYDDNASCIIVPQMTQLFL